METPTKQPSSRLFILGSDAPGKGPFNAAFLASGLLALVALTLVLNHPTVRFERTAPALLMLPDGTSASAAAQVRGGLVAEPSPEGALLRPTGTRRGSLRWELPAATGLDRLHVTGAVHIIRDPPPPAARQLARLLIVQPADGQRRTYRRLVARWPADASPKGFDRWIRVPDPTRPLRVVLIVKPHAGPLLLERLHLSGFVERTWVEVARWILLSLWISVLVWGGWRLARPMTIAARWASMSVMTLLVAGILAPPSVLRSIRALLSAWLPIGSTAGPGLDTETLGHFGLFAVLAAILCHARSDLGSLRLLLLLAGLAGVTELLQLFIDGRQPDGHDLAVDLMGTAIGLLLGSGLRGPQQEKRFPLP